MISVITPTFNTDQAALLRTWNSLKAQTHADWEWVVWDDSTESNTWNTLIGLAADERFRINLFRGHRHSGAIGHVKKMAFLLARGDILVELDHDDELTPDCLAEIEIAFSDKSVGFAFSDWCEILPDGLSGKYPEGWAFGFGSEYWDEEREIWVMKSPPINRTTLGHIVSVPNHVRAWRRSVYLSLDGHNPNLPIADDYDLIVRTVLATTWCHIPKLLYVQHIGARTAQREKNALIQRLIPEIHNQYRSALDQKFGAPGEPINELP
jgi:glycosyltransferase involved in cell wall biosynthesis